MTSQWRPASAGRLRRSLRPGGVLTLTLAALSPAGSVFVTGAAVLHLAGTGAVAALLGGGVAVMVGTLLYAELGSSFPHAGGVYHGIGQVLGPRAGAAALALGLITAPALIAFAALGLATYVRALSPSLPTESVALAAILLATAVGVLRLRAGLWLTGTLLAAELAALVALIALEWGHSTRGLATVLLHPVIAGPHGGLAPVTAVPLALATIAAAYACSGSNLALNFAEEIDGDRRSIGHVVVLGGVLAIALVALPLVSVTLGTPDLAATLAADAPIAASVSAIAGAAVARAFATVAALAILDHIAGAVIAYSRLVFAAARSIGGAVGPWAALARLDRRTGAPVVATLALGAIAAVMTLIGERGLLLFVSGEIITPALMIVAVLVGRRRRQTGERGFRSPFYPFLPWAGLAIIATFFASDLLDGTARLSIAILAVLAGFAAARSRPFWKGLSSA